MIELIRKEGIISEIDVQTLLDEFIELRAAAAKRVLLLPPDLTRMHSRAGMIAAYLYGRLQSTAEVFLMPALGTHAPMTEQEIRRMFGPDIPLDRFLEHDWRKGVKRYGIIEGARVSELSEGRVDFSIDVMVNRILDEGGFDLIVSIGQVVPHEVIGMANYTKNILVGVGGGDIINKSHFLGACYGMERIMGRIDSPVRQVLNEGFDRFLSHLPIEFILTVVGKEGEDTALKGLYCGSGVEVYQKAARLSQQLNIDYLDRPIHKAVVYLDPEEFKTTWLGNKAIYRLRMAMADAGELIVLAPALRRFGEDMGIDALIRKHGYRTTEHALAAVQSDPELGSNLSAAAHLIHGSSEGRFTVRYCPGPGVSREEIESVGYEWGDLSAMMERYPVESLADGWNETEEGEAFFYVSNPALGLWSSTRF